MVPPRRKKWTEAEEKTLIDKYGEMVSDGTLAKMKTREKKNKPIALHVNSTHHVRDPIAYPWRWTWKDVFIKVQNMRHQYLLVKQKIKKPDNEDEFDWVEGLTHWSNFSHYKEVLGDVPAAYSGNGGSGNDLVGVSNEERENGMYGNDGIWADGDFAGIAGSENGVIGLGFDYEGEEAEENYNSNARANREEGDEGLFGQLREMEAQFEQHELETKRERQRWNNKRLRREHECEQKLEQREKERIDREKARKMLRKQRVGEWESMMKENEERERRRRREEQLIQESDWEERMNRKRSECKKQIDGMLSQHRAEMGQIQTRIMHEQQNLTSQLLGIVSHNHYLSQIIQNLHHVNYMVHGDNRIDSPDDQFIVDG
ncbi:hypothetical protein Tsubulata_036573 [Turnera subulata]|uniref:Uncharacterized protein n=1 Tax=Turnera subulata TaxID=218843 RepID=A0A9Q0F8J9_9ROSI|nr:hypothetical protein Tsubulata_036573 [Turnera subulata]